MRGYWNRPEDTSKVLDADGWLHTGDIGRIEWTPLHHGRIKEILVLSTARKSQPVDLKMAITGDPLFEQAMVAAKAAARLCAAGCESACMGSPVREPGTYQKIPMACSAAAKAALDHVAARLEAFPACARVRKVWLTREPWTIEAGLITPTMKLKREALAQQCKDQIEALYRDAG
jgi:long-chain acyl-CoA synthetase